MSVEPKKNSGWREFWGGEHSIYVNARHRAVHYEQVGADLVALVALRHSPRVLDWGCGDALAAPALATVCSELLLYDAVPAVQQRLKERFGGAPGPQVLDTAAWDALPPASLDVIIMNSVAQYLSRAELEGVLEQFRRRLRPDGEIILADIIPPHIGMAADIAALLAPAAKHGYFGAACVGLVRTFFSEYRQLRRTAGFSCYEEPDFIALLEGHGLTAERLPRNVGFNQKRMAFRARPRSPDR